MGFTTRRTRRRTTAPAHLQDVDIQKLLRGHQGTLLELLQWLCKYLDGKEPAKHYDPAARRASSKNGNCSRMPAFGASKEAFRRWKMRGAAAARLLCFPLALHWPRTCPADQRAVHS